MIDKIIPKIIIKTQNKAVKTNATQPQIPGDEKKKLFEQTKK